MQKQVRVTSNPDQTAWMWSVFEVEKCVASSALEYDGPENAFYAALLHRVKNVATAS